jgi:hypothetical protein
MARPNRTAVKVKVRWSWPWPTETVGPSFTSPVQGSLIVLHARDPLSCRSGSVLRLSSNTGHRISNFNAPLFLNGTEGGLL